MTVAAVVIGALRHIEAQRLAGAPLRRPPFRRRRMMRAALTALPWLGVRALGFGDGYVGFVTLTMPHRGRQ